MNYLLRKVTENPEQAKEIVEELIGEFRVEYKPLLYMVLSELFKFYKDYANNTEYFATVAKVRKNQFDAYLSVGFSEDQAITLMINDVKQMKENVKNYSKNINANSKK